MTDNKKRGRPKAINPRSKQYRIRLTDDECKTLKTIAKKHNLSVSKLIRSRIIEGELNSVRIFINNRIVVN